MVTPSTFTSHALRLQTAICKVVPHDVSKVMVAISNFDDVDVTIEPGALLGYAYPLHSWKEMPSDDQPDPQVHVVKTQNENFCENGDARNLLNSHVPLSLTASKLVSFERS